MAEFRKKDGESAVVDKVKKDVEELSREIKTKFEQIRKEVPVKKDMEELKKSVDEMKKTGWQIQRMLRKKSGSHL